jgi:hypothetical protein
MPVPGPANPAHTPTPAQFTVGSVLRDPASKAVALRANAPSTDGTLDWIVHTTDYGAYYASWDDVGTWTPMYVGLLLGQGTLAAVAHAVPQAQFAGVGTLRAMASKVRPVKLSGVGTLSATAGLLTAEFSGAGTLTATAELAGKRAVDFAGEGTLTATAT